MASGSSSVDPIDSYDELVDLYWHPLPSIVPHIIPMPQQPQEVVFNGLVPPGATRPDPLPSDDKVWLYNAHPTSFIGEVVGGSNDDDVDRFIKQANPALYERLFGFKLAREESGTQLASLDEVLTGQHPNKLSARRSQRVPKVLSKKRKVEESFKEKYADPDLVLLKKPAASKKIDDHPTSKGGADTRASQIPTRRTPPEKAANLAVNVDGPFPEDVSRTHILEAAERLQLQLYTTSSLAVPSSDLSNVSETSVSADLPEGRYTFLPNSTEALAERTARQNDTAETLHILRGIERKRELRALFLHGNEHEPTLKILSPVDRISQLRTGLIYKKQGLRPWDRWNNNKKNDNGTQNVEHDNEYPRPTKVQDVLNEEDDEFGGRPLPCSCNEIDWENPMVQCAAEFCPIGWYHLACTELEYIPAEDGKPANRPLSFPPHVLNIHPSEIWYCPTCAEIFCPKPKSAFTHNTAPSSASSPTPSSPSSPSGLLPLYHHETPPSSPPAPSFANPPTIPFPSTTYSSPTSPSSSASTFTTTSPHSPTAPSESIGSTSTSTSSSPSSSPSSQSQSPSPSPAPQSSSPPTLSPPSPTPSSTSTDKITPTTADFLRDQTYAIPNDDDDGDSQDEGWDTEFADDEDDGMGFMDSEQDEAGRPAAADGVGMGIARGVGGGVFVASRERPRWA